MPVFYTPDYRIQLRTPSQFGKIGDGTEPYPAILPVDYGVVQVPMRSESVGRDKGGFDLTVQGRVEYDFRRGEIGLR